MPGMKKYFEFMAKYYPDGDKDSSFNSYGYSTSQLMIYVLQKCGDNLTRENVMKQATSLKNVSSICRCRASSPTPRRTIIASTSSCR